MATFELDLSPQQPLDLVGSLAVVGQRIVPLGIAIEMVLGALRELYSARAPELRDLRAFGSPPLESLRRLCATLDERTARFRVSGWVEDEARGQPREEILVDGAFAESSLGHARSQPPPLMAADESQVLAEPYPLLTARGYEIGPALRALGEVRQRPGRAEAMLEPVPISELFVIDPVLSAAGFQLVQLASIDEAERTPRVITSIERVSVFPSAAPVAELTLEESGGTSDRRATIHGLSAEREPVFVIEGVRWSAGKDAAEQRRAAFIAHITKLVSDLLPDRKLGASDDLVRCGARSLDFVRIVSALRSDLGCEVALSRLIERPTIEGIAELCIESGRAADPVSWSEEAVEGLGLGAGNLSYAQEQLWFLEQLGDLGCAYNEGIAIEIESVIDAAAFERALAALTARHGALRSCFVGSADSVRRQPSAHGEPSLHGIDLTGLSEVEARQRFLRATRDAMRQAFDLASGPLVRALVASSSARSYVALLAHHIIVDGWSLRQVVLPELATLYESELAGRAAELPEAPAYGKFVHWERATVAAIAARPGAFDWWRSELQDLPSVLALPLDQPRPLRASHRGRVLAVPVEPELWAGVTELAAGQGVTTFVVLLAAYELLLATYGRQSKLCVGVIAANRMRSEHERVVGLFANLLPLRAEVLPEQSVVELLASIRQRVYASVDRQSIPFSRIVAELGVPRDLSVNPLVQAVFAFEEPPPPLHFGGANADLLAIDNDTSKFDLTLTVKASADDRSGVAVFEYREDLFTEATARELARTWTWLLHRMVERPSASLGELPWVDPEQAMQIIGQSSGRRAALPSVRLHERFEEQARRTPDAVAVSHADRTLTYRELNARANRLAHWLVMQGAERDAAIGVRVRRSSELLVAVLGILKAGAAYLPLDRAL
ncbi:MAG TPA: condensation domain-containing protein, partial [Polyangiales bacterium]|nr:condensation domain-containing protein [Polyangiales bacterium]